MGTNFAPAPKAPSGDPPSHSQTKAKRSLWWLWVFLVLVIVAGVKYFPQVTEGATKGGKGTEPPISKKGAQIVPVVAATAKRGDLPIYLTGLGSVQAFNTVVIRSRVDGELMKVAFTEGQLVHEGDPLAEIDPRPYEALLNQAQGQLSKDQALLDNAKVDQGRYQSLSAQGVVSKQMLDTQTASVRTLEGAVHADQGNIENIKLNLYYCHITAKLTGRLGLRLVDQGNMVHANDPNGIATIAQVQPIAVVFNLAQDFLPDVMKKFRAGQQLGVEAWDRDFKKKLGTGKLLTLDNAIDPSTGTARFKAEFANEDDSLFPNQFVNARLLLDTRHGSVLVPAPAVQRSPQSSFVYVVKEDQTVEMRNVVPGPIEGDNASIESGLQAGEVVVVDGVDKLQQGTRVEARTNSQEKSSKSGKK